MSDVMQMKMEEAPQDIFQLWQALQVNMKGPVKWKLKCRLLLLFQNACDVCSLLILTPLMRPVPGSLKRAMVLSIILKSWDVTFVGALIGSVSLGFQFLSGAFLQN
jgi:hypothetical protein